jgi:hypothetical protein
VIFTVFYQLSTVPRCSGALTIRADSRDDAIDYARRKVLRLVPDRDPAHIDITSVFTQEELSQCIR